MMLFEYPASLELSTRAFRFAEAARDTATMLRSLRVRVVALEKTGGLDVAKQLCARAAAIAKRRNQPRDEAYFHTRHGYALVSQGRSREALPWFESALGSGERAKDEGDQLRAVAGLAAAQYQVGKLHEARASYARGIALAKKLDNPFGAYLCLTTPTWKWRSAIPISRPFRAHAIEASRRAALLPVELQARRILANYESARGAWDRVDSLMTVTIALAEPLGDREPLSSSLLTAAKARIELGRPGEAEALMRRAVSLVDTLIPVNAAFASQTSSTPFTRRAATRTPCATPTTFVARLSKRMPASSLWRVRYRGHARPALGRHREALATTGRSRSPPNHSAASARWTARSWASGERSPRGSARAARVRARTCCSTTRTTAATSASRTRTRCSIRAVARAGTVA
ncbi:MAG: hypothetical protein IPJ04_14830 [Candidatus Eisenbacteria bacterium]|nr:hypothetical protein [Candidatus Eisenbacteria bacterium]